MRISVFCGASLPHSEQITEAARQLGRAIARCGRFSARKSTPHPCAVKLTE